MKTLKRYLVTGLLVAGPVVLTVYVLFIVFRFADNILGRYLNSYFQRAFGFYIPGIGFFIAVIFVIFIGFLANHFVGRRIFPFLERQFSALPLIKSIYPAFKQIVRFILQQKEFGFQKVVLVEYPSKGIWSLGFLTNEEFTQIDAACARPMAAVFVPSSPGPLTGYVVFVPRESVVFLDMPVSEAIKIIISGGVFKSSVKA